MTYRANLKTAFNGKVGNLERGDTVYVPADLLVGALDEPLTPAIGGDVAVLVISIDAYPADPSFAEVVGQFDGQFVTFVADPFQTFPYSA